MKDGSRQIGKRWYFAIALALYLYFLLPATAMLFYELHHFTGINGIYWGYSIFKVADYYLGILPYKLVLCIGLAFVAIIIPSMIGKAFKGRSHG